MDAAPNRSQEEDAESGVGPIEHRSEGAPQTAPGGPRAESLAFERIEARSGIDYALRTMQQSQVQFSLMADAKSNIMITVCSIVVSASLTQIHRPEFRLPLLILDVFTIIALMAALLCVLPSRRRPEMQNGRPDLSASTFNPLFFMHFQHLTIDEFQSELERAFASNGELYRSLSRDVYEAGRVLATGKYRLLRISYISFMVGLVASLSAWAAVSFGDFAR